MSPKSLKTQNPKKNKNSKNIEKTFKKKLTFPTSMIVDKVVAPRTKRKVKCGAIGSYIIGSLYSADIYCWHF